MLIRLDNTLVPCTMHEFAAGPCGGGVMSLVDLVQLASCDPAGSMAGLFQMPLPGEVSKLAVSQPLHFTSR